MITVYSKPQCPQCEQTKRQLRKSGIEFIVSDVTEDSTAYETVKTLGYQALPVVVTGDRHWSGFRPDLIRGLDANYAGQ